LQLAINDSPTSSGELRWKDSSVTGARRDKQFSFALLDEWVPAAKSLSRDEALAELAMRHFSSHGPATFQDFKWSGLAAAEIKSGFGFVESHFKQVNIDGRAHWFAKGTELISDSTPVAHFLPAFDEFLVGYKDRSAALDPKDARRHVQSNAGGLLSPTIVINGRVVGTWRRTLKKGSVVVASTLFTLLTRAEKRAVEVAVLKFGGFLELPLRSGS
jgi:hypothetical protein